MVVLNGDDFAVVERKNVFRFQGGVVGGKVRKPAVKDLVIPDTSSLPEPLFERGVRVVGGVQVTNPDKLLEILSAGGSGYHFLDKYADRIVIEKGKR